jgi:hypothetical protein
MVMVIQERKLWTWCSLFIPTGLSLWRPILCIPTMTTYSCGIIVYLALPELRRPGCPGLGVDLGKFLEHPLPSLRIVFDRSFSLIFKGTSLSLCNVKKIQGLAWISAFMGKKQNISTLHIL